MSSGVKRVREHYGAVTTVINNIINAPGFTDSEWDACTEDAMLKLVCVGEGLGIELRMNIAAGIRTS